MKNIKILLFGKFRIFWAFVNTSNNINFVSQRQWGVVFLSFMLIGFIKCHRPINDQNNSNDRSTHELIGRYPEVKTYQINQLQRVLCIWLVTTNAVAGQGIRTQGCPFGSPTLYRRAMLRGVLSGVGRLFGVSLSSIYTDCLEKELADYLMSARHPSNITVTAD